MLLYGPHSYKQPSFPGRQGKAPISEPVILPRAQHSISRALISESALKVLHRLRDAGYASLLVGGCVRDLMLGREPKDFDVVTDARPEEIRKLFSSARIIGRRFRLVHVRFGRGIIEVATFRAIPRDISEEGRPDEDMADDAGEAEEAPASVADQNIFGNQEEDARRRDFTVNALYYDIRDFSVVDYANGVDDLKAGVLRMIGDPEARYREDPVRMLRVVRFAAKLSFKIEAKTEAPIERLAHLLATVPPARMFEEVLKLFHGGYALETFELLRRYNLFQYLFPLTDECLSREDQGFPRTLVPRALANTDARVGQGKPVTPAFLFAAMLWEPVCQQMQSLAERGQTGYEALMRATDMVLQEQLQHVSIPRRFSVPMREIWAMQERLVRRGGRQAFRLIEDKRFRAAYDFLLLRADTG
ncbi:MAG: polynucleotide adenylyltransferase PcnB, partial [Gammaproteobacteria bacterium]|nr:polynucleotide adenylyltransferase PcnB [Gammaproteobacteria bacterium]